MKKTASIKLFYEDMYHKIEATDIKEEGTYIIIYDNERVVGQFPSNSVENWSLETRD